MIKISKEENKNANDDIMQEAIEFLLFCIMNYIKMNYCYGDNEHMLTY